MRNPRKLGVLAAGIALASMSLVATSPATATGRPHAKSQTHIVHPGESIQDAVDAAHRGDTVVVTAGTYYQTVVVQKNGLTLRARGHVTLAPPATAPRGICDSDDELVGICVVPADLDPDEFTYTFRVRGVTVRRLQGGRLR